MPEVFFGTSHKVSSCKREAGGAFVRSVPLARRETILRDAGDAFVRSVLAQTGRSLAVYPPDS